MARGLEDPAAPQSPVSLMESSDCFREWRLGGGEAEIWMQTQGNPRLSFPHLGRGEGPLPLAFLVKAGLLAMNSISFY